MGVFGLNMRYFLAIFILEESFFVITKWFSSIRMIKISISVIPLQSPRVGSKKKSLQSSSLKEKKWNFLR
jgi:hypothetical protein